MALATPVSVDFKLPSGLRLAGWHTGSALPSQPVLCLHGWLDNANSFLPLATALSELPLLALDLAGHGHSSHRSVDAHYYLFDYVADIATLCRQQGWQQLTIIGHSMGGMVVQKCMEVRQVSGAVLMASVPPQGLWASAVGLALRKPDLMSELNNLLTGGGTSPEVLREALFAQPVSMERLQQMARRVQPESARVIWDMTLFDLPQPSRMRRAPLLVLGAECDPIIPPSLTDMTARALDVEARIFPGMGHGMMLEAEWRKVAQCVLDWIPMACRRAHSQSHGAGVV